MVVGVVLWWLLLLQLVSVICHSSHLKHGEEDNRQDAFSRAPVAGTRPSRAERHITHWCSKTHWCTRCTQPGRKLQTLGCFIAVKVHQCEDDKVCTIRMKNRGVQGGGRTEVRTQDCLHVCDVLPADVNIWLSVRHPPRCNCQLFPESAISCAASRMVRVLSLSLQKPWVHS